MRQNKVDFLKENKVTEGLKDDEVISIWEKKNRASEISFEGQEGF